MIAAVLAAALAFLPDPTTTPGALNPDVTQANIGETICRPGWTKTIRPKVSYTNRLKVQQLATLGLGDVDPRTAEEDHRVPLELGGAPRDPRNLWPQPFAGPFGARAKDKLETATRRHVCAGRLTLDQARALFLAQDWTVTYRAWFGDPPTN